VSAAAAHATEARAAPYAELRTSLGLASLGAALVHLMSAAHGTGAFTLFATAAIQAVLAALFAFTGSRAVLGPALALNATLTLGWAWSRTGGLPVELPGVLAALTQLAVAGGALALLRGTGDHAYARWSKLAFAVFTAAALSGFGHLGH
jgi:hypothetical protein